MKAVRRMKPQPWIKPRVRELGKTLRALGEAMGGLDGSRLTEIMAGTRRVQPPEIEPMAKYLELPYDEVYMRLFGISPESRANSASHQAVSNKVDTSVSVLIPLWNIRALAGGQGGEILQMSDSLAAAPAELRLVPDSFAVHYWDDLNLPFLRRGATLFVNPSSVPRIGDWCLFTGRRDADSGILQNPRVGLLMGKKALSWIFQQGPTKGFLAVADWPIAMLIEWIKP